MSEVRAISQTRFLFGWSSLFVGKTEGKTAEDKQGMRGARGFGLQGELGACVGELASEGNRVAEGRVECQQLEAAGRENSQE